MSVMHTHRNSISSGEWKERCCCNRFADEDPKLLIKKFKINLEAMNIEIVPCSVVLADDGTSFEKHVGGKMRWCNQDSFNKIKDNAFFQPDSKPADPASESAKKFDSAANRLRAKHHREEMHAGFAQLENIASDTVEKAQISAVLNLKQCNRDETFGREAIYRNWQIENRDLETQMEQKRRLIVQAARNCEGEQNSNGKKGTAKPQVSEGTLSTVIVVILCIIAGILIAVGCIASHRVQKLGDSDRM